MRISCFVSVPLFLVLIPGLSQAQAREGSPGEDAWSAYPEARPAASSAPADEARFEPIDYPGASAAAEPAEGPTVEPAAPTLTPVVRDSSPMLEDTRTTTLGASESDEGVAVTSGRAATPGPAATTKSPSASPGPSARDAAASLSLLPPPSTATLAPRLTPEPLAVPLLRAVLDFAGASAATLSAGVAMEALVGTRCLREADRMCALTSFLVTMLSVSATAPVGAWAVGSLLGGEGKLWAAYLGAAMGMGLGVIGTMPTLAFGSGIILAVAGPIGAVVGAAIGYEVSHWRVRRGTSRSAERSRGVTVTPLVASTGSGSVVGGMMGRF